MEKKNLNYIRDSLSVHHAFLLDWLKGDSEKQEILLGGTTVKEVKKIVSQIQNTLERIDGNQFGRCSKCKGEIESECLELDYTTDVCLEHYSDDQLRTLEKDLELTAKVQKHLYPCCVPSLPGMEIAVFTKSARILSGDYYDFFGYDNGAQGITIADVMGKGLAASMLMSNLQASIRILGPEYENLDELASHLNRLFCHNLKMIRFISIFLARIDIKSGLFHYCNAGHNPVIRYNGLSGLIEFLNPTGPALGVVKDAGYKMDEQKLNSGDMFLFYTDGILDARNPDEIEFGEERLTRFLEENHHLMAEKFIAKLLERVKRFAGRFEDDVTLLVVKNI